MRVLILSHYYKPEPIPKPAEMAAGLREHGDDVTVVTGFPNYPAGVLYTGYRLGLVRHDHDDGTPIIRTLVYPYHGKSALGRFANYASFMLSAPVGALFAPACDVMYVWHPPLTIGLAAWVIARLRGVPFVYDVQDIWPEAAVLSGILKPGIIVRLLSCLERFVYGRADHIITVTEGARRNLISKGVRPGKVTAMPHWFDISLFRPDSIPQRDALRMRYGWNDKCVVLFAGNIGIVQGLDVMVRAADLLRREQKIHFVIVGDGADKSRLQERVRSLELASTVQFIDRQPLGAMPAFLAAADALLVHLLDSELSNYAIPTKTLAYLGSGTPLIVAMHGAAAELVREARGGIVIPPENPEALAQAVREIAATAREDRLAMGRAGQTYLRQNLSRAVVLPQYRALLGKVADDASAGRNGHVA